MTRGVRKRTVIVSGAAASAIVLLAWTQTWVTVTLESGQSLAVGGDVAAPALAALALSGLALVGALTIAGRVFRIVLGVLAIAIGSLVVVSASLALIAPIGAASAAITAATAVAGDASVADLVTASEVSLWPVVAIVAGVLLAITGAATVVAGRGWPASSRKYQPVGAEPAAERSNVGDWDSLSDGHDPTAR